MVNGKVLVLFLIVVAGTASARRFDDTGRNRRQGQYEEERVQEYPDKNFEGNFEDSPLAKEESEGFIVGMPNGFPNFQSLGGFEPMKDDFKGAENFVQEFKMPSINIGDLDHEQPQLGPDNFRQDKNISSSASAKTNEKELNSTYEDHEKHDSIRHVTVARKGADPQDHISLKRVTRQFPSFPFFEFPNEGRDQSRREDFTPRFESQHVPSRHPQNDERVVPESQRFYPSFNQQPTKRGSNQGFHPSEPHPGARGGGPQPFASRRPSFRSHGAHEAVHSPKFAFASNKFTDFGPVDNSLLGSGNFEIIKGGTFYDDDNPHRNHNPYDPYLDNSFVIFPSGNPHAHNHVDDFFSNFRDFSEFATRRSGTAHYPGDEGDGFASEHVAQVSTLEDMMTSETETDTNSTSIKIPEKPSEEKGIQRHPDKIVILLNHKNEQSKLTKQSKSQKAKKYVSEPSKKQTKDKSKTPKNIQDVLQELDPFPRATDSVTKSSEDEQDPLIAIF